MVSDINGIRFSKALFEAGELPPMGFYLNPSVRNSISNIVQPNDIRQLITALPNEAVSTSTINRFWGTLNDGKLGSVSFQKCCQALNLLTGWQLSYSQYCATGKQEQDALFEKLGNRINDSAQDEALWRQLGDQYGELLKRRVNPQPLPAFLESALGAQRPGADLGGGQHGTSGETTDTPVLISNVPTKAEHGKQPIPADTVSLVEMETPGASAEKTPHSAFYSVQSCVLGVLVLVFCGVLWLVITSDNAPTPQRSIESRVAMLEKIQRLTSRARDSGKVDATWIVEELDALAVNLDALPALEAKARFGQIEVYLDSMDTINKHISNRGKALARLPKAKNCYYPQILIFRGQILLDMRENKDAETEFTTALTLPSDELVRIKATLGLADAFSRQNDKYDSATEQWGRAIILIRSATHENPKLLCQALIGKASTYVAINDLMAAIRELTMFFEELKPGTLMDVTMPLQLVNMMNSIKERNQDLKLVEKIDELRELASSEVNQVGVGGKEYLDPIMLAEFMIAAIANLSTELEQNWEISDGQFQLASEIINAPNLARHVSQQQKLSFDTVRLGVSAKMAGSGVKVSEDKLQGIRDILAKPLSEIESSLFAFLAFETSVEILAYYLGNDEMTVSGFEKQAEEMSKFLRMVKALPNKYKQRVQRIKSRMEEVVEKARQEKKAIAIVVSLHGDLDGHEFNFQRTILDGDELD